MLASLLLRDWKSFGAADDARGVVRFAPVTLLVGPNASGKSNVFDALRFLQGAALDIPLSDVLRGRWEGQRQTWPPIRGHLAEATHDGASGFLLESRWIFADGGATHRLSVGVGRDAEVEEEGLFDPSGAYLFHTHAKALGAQAGRREGGSVRVALKSRGKGKPVTMTLSAQRSVLGQILSMPAHERAREMLGTVLAVDRALREVIFLDIRPEAMRGYRPEGGPLGVSGENVSPALFAMASAERQDVVDWLSELCAPEIEAIDFDRTQLAEVMMFVVERGGRRVSARSMSDGTLRFLGLLVALLTCPEGALVLLEEPDVGLHPSRIRLLAELFESVAARRKVQIVATTHSPGLLAHLDVGLGGRVRPRSGERRHHLLSARRSRIFRDATGRGGSRAPHLDGMGGARAMKVLVIPEDQALDQYIVKPVVEAMLSDAGIPGRVDVLAEPRPRGAAMALDPGVIAGIVAQNPMVDLFLLIIDRDCDRENNDERAAARQREHEGRLLACVAQHEIEVWMLALYADRLDAGFADVRRECDPKERWAEPLLDTLGRDGPGRGRKRAMRALAGSWRSLAGRCPELVSLQASVRAFRAAPQ